MNRKTVGLTSRAAILALAFIMVASLGLLPLDGVAYAQTAAPANLQASAPPDGSRVDVSWGEVTGADSYQLYRQVNGGAWSSAMPMTGTSYSDTNVSAGMTYGYYVRAVTAGTPGAWSDYASATVPGGVSRPTAAPANLQVAADGLTAVDVSWGAVSGAATYSIYRWDGTAGEWIHGLTSSPYKDTGLTSGTTYSYNIRAVNAAGNGPWSGYQSVTLEETTAVPVLTHTHPARETVILSWTQVADNAEYELQRKTDVDQGTTGDVDWAPLPDSLLSGTSYTDPKALYVSGSRSTTYYYRVRAIIDDNEGEWSDEVMVAIPSTATLPASPSPEVIFIDLR